MPSIPKDLLSLPNELLEAILALTRPEGGFEQICLSCKTIYNTAHSSGLIHKHNELKKKYSTCLALPLDNSNRSIGEREHPVTVINDIVQDPLVASYIKTITLAPVKPPHLHVLDSTRRALKELRNSEAFLGLLQTNPYLKIAKQDARRWHDLILGDEEHLSHWTDQPHAAYPKYVFAFLLSLLPNLTRLQFYEPWRDFLPWNDYNKSSSYERFGPYKVINALCTRTDDNGAVGLERLSEIGLEAGGSCEYSIETFLPFTYLPSLRKVNMGILTNRETCNYRWPRGICFQLETLSLECGALDCQSLEKLLSLMPYLQNLTCAYTERGVGRLLPMRSQDELNRVIASCPAKSTLKSLQLNVSLGIGEKPTVTFQNLSNLSHVRITVSVLCWPVDDWYVGRKQSYDFRRLVDILPVSIEHVVIELQEPTPLHSAVLDGIGDDADALPKLRSVSVVGKEDGMWVHFDPCSQNLGFPWWVRGRGIVSNELGLLEQARQAGLAHQARARLGLQA